MSVVHHDLLAGDILGRGKELDLLGRVLGDGRRAAQRIKVVFEERLFGETGDGAESFAPRGHVGIWGRAGEGRLDALDVTGDELELCVGIRGP